MKYCSEPSDALARVSCSAFEELEDVGPSFPETEYGDASLCEHETNVFILDIGVIHLGRAVRSDETRLTAL
jgi:hypothetical protein